MEIVTENTVIKPSENGTTRKRNWILFRFGTSFARERERDSFF